jgi:hypothetical protein
MGRYAIRTCTVGEVTPHQIEARPPTSSGWTFTCPTAEKRTTGRMVAFKRYSGGLFTAHGPLMASIQTFRTCYASCL